MSQEEFNEHVLGALESLSRSVQGMNGVIAGLMADVDELKGNPVNPVLRRIQRKNIAEFLENRSDWADGERSER